MNIEEWVEYFEVEDIEDVTFYKEFPCIEKREGAVQKKILYPLPFLEMCAANLPPCTITHLSYIIQDDGMEILALDLEFEHFGCFFSLVLNHADEDRYVAFTESVAIKTFGFSKSPAYVSLLQIIYTLMENFIDHFSPSRLELVTSTYEFRLPAGVKRA